MVPPATLSFMAAGFACAPSMSLTSMLKDKEVKAMFRQAFPVKRERLEGLMLASPITSRATLVGTAFDYLLRFHLERAFGACDARLWVAEGAVAMLNVGLVACGEKLRAEANSRLEGAREARHNYLKTGDVTDGLLGAALNLAQLDVVYRADVAYDFVDADDSDTRDLRNLVDVATDKFPRPRAGSWTSLKGPQGRCSPRGRSPTRCLGAGAGAGPRSP